MSQELKDTSLFADANLKAYYRFESGALTTDSTTNGHTLTAISDPAEGTGKFGGGVDLDGNDAYSATDHADFKPTGAFSVGCWFKTSNAGAQVFFQSQSQNTNVAGYIIYINAGNIVFQSGKNSGTTYHTDYDSISSTLSTYADGVWHQVVGVSDGSYLRLYVDGNVAGTAVSWANAPAYAATNYVRIGCYNISGSDSLMLTGSLDDLFLLNGTALTAAQVANLYDRGIKKINGVYMGSQEIASTALASDASLKAYYRFNSGALTTDSSGNGYTLTNNNSVAEVAGKFGGAASQGTSNTNKYLSTTNTMGIDGGNFTFHSFIKINTEVPSDLYVLFSQANNTSKVYFAIFYEYNGGTRRLKFVRTKQGVAEQSFVYNITLGTTDFYQIDLTYDGTNLCGYVNGNLVGQVAASGNGSSAVTSGFYLGAFWDGTSSPSSQTSDDVFIASRSLTSDEIYSLYKTGVKKLNGQVNLNPELESTSLRGDANLVSYWKMEDVNDSKGTNHLTNNGTATFVSGKFNNGLNLVAASSQYLSIADASQTGLDLSTDFTISAWIKIASLPSTLGTAFVIVAKDDSSGQRSYQFRILNNNILTCTWLDAAGNYSDPSTTSSIVTATDIGQWVHLVVTTDISVPSAVFYKNGVAVAGANASSSGATSIKNSTADFRIGDLSTAAHNYFNGMIDDVAIFSRALTATEISNLYNTNIKKYNSVSNV